MNKLKSNKGWLAAGALVGVLAIGGSATAHGFGRGGHGFPMMRVLRHLDLTEAQEIQAVKIRRALRAQHKAARAQMDATMNNVRAELGKANPNAQVLHGAVDQAMDQMKAGLHTAVDQFLVLHQTLTPEQRAKLIQAMDRMKKRRDKHMGRFQQANP